MSDTDGTVHHLSQGSMAATHPSTDDSRDSPVAPVYTNEMNTLRMNLIARACWKLEDMRFAFDSSFVLPAAREDMPHLRSLIQYFAITDNGVTQNPPLSVFGHADPTGSDVYNKTLSQHRAEAVYAALTRRTDLWEQMYSNPPPMSGDDWNRVDCISIMLGSVLTAPSGDKTTDVKTFQQQSGLTVDGIAGPQTRQKLFQAYMDYLCGKDFVVAKTDFLAQGADSNGKGDYQGCSRLNPLLLFSSDHLAFLEQPENHTQRDKENAINRRVMIFLYDPGRKVDPAKWPCPTAAEGVTGCYKRFWADGDLRRQNGPVERKYKLTHDTFACRFYQRFADTSNCENPPSGLGFLSVVVFFHQQPIADLTVQFYQSNDSSSDNSDTSQGANGTGSSSAASSGSGAGTDGSDPNPTTGVTAGDPVGGQLTTDKNGMAKLTKPVPVGNYVCQVQYQPNTLVSTVSDPDDPFILVLPIGRPYYDFHNDYEFNQDPDS